MKNFFCRIRRFLINPLQYSCLENPMDRGAWQATVHGVARVRHDLAAKPPPPVSVVKVIHKSTIRYGSINAACQYMWASDFKKHHGTALP